MASAEELCEREVLWPETAHDEGDGDDATPSCSSSPPVAPRSRTPAPAPRPRGGVPGSERPTTTTRAGSRPVDIQRPASSARRRGHEDGDRDRDWSAATMVPPHVLVSRRRREAPCALLRPGARELSHLRDSVLRVTGFIEG
jgi:hypothetical protein